MDEVRRLAQAEPEIASHAARWDLLPLLEHLNRTGHKVDVRHLPHLLHGPTEVASAEQISTGYLVRQRAFGLVDPASPLPEAYVELAIAEAASEKGGPWLELLDMLTAPFIQQDWRAWRVRFDGIADGDGVPQCLSMLSGELSTGSYRDALALAGFLSHGTLSSSAIQTAVAYITNAACHISEFEPEWISIPDAALGRIGTSRLGVSVVGSRSLTSDCAASITLTAGTWKVFEPFLADPVDSDLGRLLAAASEGRVSWTVALKCTSPPDTSSMATDLDGADFASKLGVNAWLGSESNAAEDYHCELSFPQVLKWRGE